MNSQMDTKSSEQGVNQTGELIWKFHTIVISYTAFKLIYYNVDSFMLAGFLASAVAVMLFRCIYLSSNSKLSILLILLCPIYAAIASMIPNPDGTYGNWVKLSQVVAMTPLDERSTAPDSPKTAPDSQISFSKAQTFQTR
jgi:hypothetical protein